MNIISINRKIKAILIRLRIHRWLGFIENIFLNASYMIRLSRWVDTNRQILIYDDFYNAQPKHGERFQLYKQILDTYTLNEENITYLEFGVASGTSMRWWTDHNIAPSSNFWGFDTFEGLPERYGSLKQGVFNMKGQFRRSATNESILSRDYFRTLYWKILNSLIFQTVSYCISIRIYLLPPYTY